MGLYNFKKQFAPMILNGAKTHTIRGLRRFPDKPGNTLHLYTGLRTKGTALLMKALCTSVQSIAITECGAIAVDGLALADDEAEQLAVRDGFGDLAAMLLFWEGRLPFAGQIVHWKPLP